MKKGREVVPYKPVGLLTSMFESEGFFEKFWGDFVKGIGRLGDVRVRDRGQNLQIEADINGFSPKDITIDIKGDYLRLRGKKDDQFEKRERGHYEYRSSHIAFERLERLPAKVAGDKVRTAYNKGTVTMRLPKTS